MNNKLEMIGTNVSPWLLNEASGEIKKDMIIYRDGKVGKRIQVIYDNIWENARTRMKAVIANCKP